MLSIDADLSEVTQAGGGVSSTTRHRVSTTALTLMGAPSWWGLFYRDRRRTIWHGSPGEGDSLQ